jgi:predicted RNA-binding Zn-ribbon protein involved in translation (DUF1610 family)
MRNPIVPLKVVPNASTGHYVSAPPILLASTHTIDFTCGACGTILMHADHGQVHSLVIHCRSCGAYNATGS